MERDRLDVMSIDKDELHPDYRDKNIQLFRIRKNG
jgi:hypothetical protein